jgi:hypothetical protein
MAKEIDQVISKFWCTGGNGRRPQTCRQRMEVNTVTWLKAVSRSFVPLSPHSASK